jgi:two-component system NarL family sensor kinase
MPSIAAALGLARQGLEEVRRSVLDLRAAPLEGRTLPEALAALAEDAEEGDEDDEGEAPAVAFAATEMPPLPAAVEVGLYRIAQEALQNALRHSGASRVAIALEMLDDRVRLIVRDDGRGFVPGAAAQEPAADRFGLLGMRERARLLGGHFEVESSPGAGTRITAEVPLADRTRPGR